MSDPAGDALPTVSVVIPTRDRIDIIPSTLDAVLADPATSEVIVMVDRGEEATHETRELLDRVAAGEPRLRWMRTPPDEQGKWGVQHGRDVGTEMAESEVVLSLDDDVIAKPGMVSGHARAHAAGKGRVVVGYMPVVSEERWPRSSAPIRYYSEAYEYTCDLYRSNPAAILPNLWGGNISLRREDWLAAIRRPRTEAWGHDDQELGVLFMRDGLQGHFDPRLEGSHYYRRNLRGFVARAENSSVAQARLRKANPDLLPEPRPQPSSLRRRLFAPALAISRWSVGWFLVRWTFIGVIAVAGALRLRSIEDAAARHLFYMASERSLARAQLQ
jgi:hypothetical protein